MISLLKNRAIGFLVAVSVFSHFSWAAPKPQIHFTLSVDWEGAFLGKKDLQAFRRFRDQHPDIPLVHFLNAAYFTQAGANAEETKNKIRSVLRPGDELGLHLHGWERLFSQAGVKFRSEPSFLKNASHSLSTVIGENGHDVAISAYTVDELRKVIRYSLDQLAAQGFSGIRSFRAGGWLAGPSVLEALAREGIQIDSSALPVSLVESTMKDHPIYEMLGRLWPQATTTSQPYKIRTAGGTLQEFPNNAGMVDYVNTAQFLKVLNENLALARKNPDQPVHLHYGFHEETANFHLPTVTQAIRQLKQAATAGEFELKPITLSQQEDLEPIAAQQQSGWIQKCIELFR